MNTERCGLNSTLDVERFAFVFFDLALDWTFTQVSRLIALLPPL
jgi:hypothetical protein